MNYSHIIFIALAGLSFQVSTVAYGQDLARQFNYILSRCVWFDDHSVNNDAAGAKGDDLPEDRDELVTISHHGHRSGRGSEICLTWQINSPGRSPPLSIDNCV